MIKENRKNIEKLLKDAKCMLIATDKGVGMIGKTPDILTCYSALTRTLSEDIDKKILEDVFKQAFMNVEELLNELKNVINKKMED